MTPNLLDGYEVSLFEIQFYNFGTIKWGVFERGGSCNNRFVLKPEVAHSQ